MAITRSEIKQWLQRGKKEKATHVIVVCDTFSHEDYPVYVTSQENVRAKAKEYDGPNMQRVMEVYNLKMDFESQLDELRAFHY